MDIRYYSDFTETFYYDIKLGEIFKLEEISLDDVGAAKNSSLYYGAKGLIREYLGLEEKIDNLHELKGNDRELLELELKLVDKRFEIQRIVNANIVNIVKYKRLKLEFTVQDVLDLWDIWLHKEGYEDGVFLGLLSIPCDLNELGVIYEDGVYKVTSMDTFKRYISENIPTYKVLVDNQLKFRQMTDGLGYAIDLQPYVEDVDGGLAVYVGCDLVYAGGNYCSIYGFEEYHVVYLALKDFLYECAEV